MTQSSAPPVAPPLVLAIDAGSSSTRALLVDRRGNAVAGSLSRVSVTLHTAPDGRVEDDAPVALQRILSCIDATLSQVGCLADQIGAVALTTYVSNVLGIAADGRPLTPIYLYSDTRNAADAAALREQYDERLILERTGCPLRSGYVPARLRWLRRTQPDLVRQVAHWVSLGEYVLLELLGATAVSLSVAAWTGLLNRHTLAWDELLLHALDLEQAMLSPLADTSVILSGLRGIYAQRWPVLAQVPWFPACSDGAAATIGSGCVSPARVALTLGTTGAVRAVMATPLAQIPWGLWCYRVDGRRALPGGATSEGGNLVAWLHAVLRLTAPHSLEQALTGYAPDSHGLTMLPFLTGERSPGWADHARVSIVGLSLATSATDILRAGLEAVAYRLALILRLLEEVLPPVQERQIVASGGMLFHMPGWAQLLADVFGQPVAILAEPEVSCRGAALLALEALGIVPDLATVPSRFQQVYAPNRAYYDQYAAAIARQQRLYAALVGSHTAMS